MSSRPRRPAPTRIGPPSRRRPLPRPLLYRPLLYARSRGAYPGATALLVIAVAGPLAGTALHAAGAGPGSALSVQVLAVTAGVALVGAGLTSPDPDLEASTPRSHARLRLTHLTVALVTVAAALTAALVLLSRPGPDLPAPDVVVTLRDVAALGGLMALCAPVLGARLSWAPGVLWTLMLLVVGPREHGWRLLASTPLLPGHAPSAAMTAGVLLLCGAALYGCRGAPR